MMISMSRKDSSRRVRDMSSSSSSSAVLVFLLVSSIIIGYATALDLEFQKITCETDLPVFAYDGDIQVMCNGKTRCSLGDEILISGTVQYRGLPYSGAYNNTGYASADLKLSTLEYELFNFLPFNFCGDWIQQYQAYDFECPANGAYSFRIPYVLPWDDNDLTSWFATGWRGTSDLVIYSEPDDTSDPLVNCRLVWSTHVTESTEEGWATLPSAGQAGIILAGVAVFLCLCCAWLSCCRSKRRHVTDEEYAKEFKTLEDSATAKAEEEEELKKLQKRRQNERMTYKINVSLKNPNPDWV